MKKFYIWFAVLFVIGVSSGIYYLKVIRPGTAKIPEHITMETAFDDEFSFNFDEQPKKARLIEFMYTNCPDVCPVTTLEMSKLRHQLQEEGIFGEEVEFITVTIDPDHDTTDVLEEYAERFEVTDPDDGWSFVRGTEEDTKELAEALRFRYRDPGSGDIIHSTFTYFLDKNNNLVEQFTMGEAFDRDKVYKRIKHTIK
ncbi:MAG TPA: SCO family protein [Bacillota bacterium]|nr:SCO family protein [Bacillota bacterium]